MRSRAARLAVEANEPLASERGVAVHVAGSAPEVLGRRDVEMPPRDGVPLADRLHEDWVWAFEAHQVRTGYRPDATQSGQRALANLALQMLVLHAVRTDDAVWPGRAYQRFKDAAQMTDRFGALAALVDGHSSLAAPANNKTKTKWQ